LKHVAFEDHNKKSLLDDIFIYVTVLDSITQWKVLVKARMQRSGHKCPLLT